MRIELRESGRLKATEGGRWSATLLTPGTGSSGTYAAEMLAEHAPKAFRKGMKLWWGHPKDDEGPGDRDARDQWGVLESDASVNESGEVEGEIRLLPHWKDVVESLGDQAALSIYALGEGDKDGNVTALLESFTNSVDIVSYPGREGSGLKKKLEAARAASPKPGTNSGAGNHPTQEDHMDPKAFAEALLPLLENAFKPINDFLVAEGARRQAEADASDSGAEVAEAVEAAVAAVEAVKAAKLLPAFETKLIESAKSGVDITADLEFAKTVTAEAGKAPKQESSAFPATYVHESAAARSADDDDFSLNLGGR